MSNNRINTKYKKQVVYNWGRVKKWMKRWSNKKVRRRQERETRKSASEVLSD